MQLNSQPTETVAVVVTTDLAQTDVTVNPSTLQFTPEDWLVPQTIAVSTNADPDAIQDPSVVLNHQASGGDYSNVPVGSVTVSVIEDDQTTLSVADAEGIEGDGEIVFAVVLDAESDRDVTARYTTVGGTAFEGVDYVAAQGTVVITSGQTTAEIAVLLIDDMDNEAAETFTLRLSEFVNANLGISSVSATATILDDDLPSVSVTTPDNSIAEGEKARFEFTRTGPLGTLLSVPITVVETGDFLAGTTPATVTFDADSREVTLELATVDDGLDEPDGEIAVTVGSSDEYVVAGAATVRVSVTDNDAVPNILIDGDRVEESVSVVSFPVTLVGTSTQTVTVDWTTGDGTATAGEDYLSANGTLTFHPGQNRETVRVSVVDDHLPEEDETFTVTLSNATKANLQVSVATVTITDNDAAVTQDWMSRFGRTVTTQVIEGVTERMDDVVTRSTFADVTGQATSMMRHGRELDLRSVVDGARFNMSRDVGARGGIFAGGTLTAWARGVYSGFGGSGAASPLDGGVLTALAGVDYELGDVLAGVAFSQSFGDGTFGSAIRDLKTATVESGLTSVYPYARYNVNERVSVWGLGGYGGGDLTLPGTLSENGVNMYVGAVGARSNLVSLTEFGTRLGLAVKSDVFFVLMKSDDQPGFALTDADANRVRLMVEARTGSQLGENATLGSKLEVGVRHDGGDAETGMGLEIGGGVSYTDRSRGLSVEATVRRMVAHQDDAYGEWGVGGSVAYQPSGPTEGLSLRVGSMWGVAESGVQQLWSPYGNRNLAKRMRDHAAQDAQNGQFGAQVHYAFAPFGEGFSMAPYANFALVGATGARPARLGWRIDVMESFRLSLESDLPGTGIPAPGGQGVMIRASLKR